MSDSNRLCLTKISKFSFSRFVLTYYFSFLALGTIFGAFETVLTAFYDHWPELRCTYAFVTNWFMQRKCILENIRQEICEKNGVKVTVYRQL